MGRGANITEPLNSAAIPPAADSGSGHSPVSAAASTQRPAFGPYPTDVPADVWDEATRQMAAVGWFARSMALGASRAILAERERCADVALSFIAKWETNSRDIEVVLARASKQDAAEDIAAAIRRGTP